MKKVVFFDLDSTLVSIEGLDVLAEKKGIGSEVKELTILSMNGDVKMEDVFGRKVDLLSPSLSELEELGQIYQSSMVKDARKVIRELKLKGYEIGVISGAFYPSILPLAQSLEIPRRLVFANDIFFDKKGSYKDFSRKSPLAKSGGKAEIVKKFTKYHTVFVGDSVTDLDTQPFVNLFVGFGGVIERKKVKEKAEAFIYKLSELPKVLEKLDH